MIVLSGESRGGGGDSKAFLKGLQFSLFQTSVEKHRQYVLLHQYPKDIDHCRRRWVLKRLHNETYFSTLEHTKVLDDIV